LSDLMAMVVTPALQRDGFQAAVALGIEAILQSPAFLYHSELGPSDAGSGVVTLTDEEIAQSLAYLVTGAPADAELSGAADLNRPALREAHARRLLETPEARAQLGQMVKQWLAIDQAGDLIKDEVQFPEFRPLMFDAESDAFIEEVVFNQGGGFQLLLGADFSVGPVELAEFYGATATSSEPGLISLAGVPRRGILNRGAFLTSYPSPTQRGVQVLTQTLCIDPGDPAALMVDMTLPPAGPSQTRRERFEQHSQAQCAGCHDMIDSIGFAFEHFDELGSWVENEAGDPERPIDSVTRLALPSQLGFGSEQLADSNELAELISTSEVGARCLARNLARFTAASHGEALEQRFLEEWEALRRAGQAGLEELLVAYVKSRPFIERAAPSAGGEP
jgi:hypothetical protein